MPHLLLQTKPRKPRICKAQAKSPPSQGSDSSQMLMLKAAEKANSPRPPHMGIATVPVCSFQFKAHSQIEKQNQNTPNQVKRGQLQLLA